MTEQMQQTPEQIDESNCLFCKIARGEIPAKKVYEDDDVIAFLDINPANEGHTLVVPKKHISTIMEADDNTLDKTIEAVGKVSKMINDNLQPHGINVLQNNGQHAGQVVAHLHFHVIPRVEGDKVMIGFPREQATEAQLDEIVAKLSGESSVEKDEFDLDI